MTGLVQDLAFVILVGQKGHGWTQSTAGRLKKNQSSWAQRGGIKDSGQVNCIGPTKSLAFIQTSDFSEEPKANESFEGERRYDSLRNLEENCKPLKFRLSCGRIGERIAGWC